MLTRCVTAAIVDGWGGRAVVVEVVDSSLAEVALDDFVPVVEKWRRYSSDASRTYRRPIQSIATGIESLAERINSRGGSLIPGRLVEWPRAAPRRRRRAVGGGGAARLGARSGVTATTAMVTIDDGTDANEEVLKVLTRGARVGVNLCHSFLLVLMCFELI